MDGRSHLQVLAHPRSAGSGVGDSGRPPGPGLQVSLCQAHRSVYAKCLFTRANQGSQRTQTKSVGNTLSQQVTGAGNNRRERPRKDLCKERLPGSPQTCSPLALAAEGAERASEEARPVSERPWVSTAPLNDQRPEGRGGCG